MTKRDELIALGGVGVKVRELEWPPRCPRGQRVHNRPALVNYTVAHYGGDVGDAIYRWAEAHSPWSDPLPTYEAAKTAAQADYEHRILSALEAPAAGDGEPVAWIDFADNGNVRLWTSEKRRADAEMALGRKMTPVFTAPPADAMREALDMVAHSGKFQCFDDDAWDVVNKALTAPGAATKSDGGALSSLPAGESKPVVMQASPSSDPSSTRSEVTVGISKDTLLSLISALDRATGDTDPSVDPDSTDEEVRREYPVFWVCQQLSALLDQFEIRRRK